MPECDVYLEYRHVNPVKDIRIKTKLGWVLFRSKGRHKNALINKLSGSPN